MLHLAITDCSLGLVGIVGRVTYSVHVTTYMTYICRVEGASVALCVDLTILGLTFLNLDRLLALVSPRYRDWMTRKKTLAVLGCLWIACFIRLTVALAPHRIHTRYLDGSFTCMLCFSENKLFTSISVIMLMVIPFTSCVLCLTGMVLIIHRHKPHAKVTSFTILHLVHDLSTTAC